MKKLYPALALVCAVSASSFAATPVAEKSATKSFEAVQSVLDNTLVSNSVKKAPAKVATAIEDVEGFYEIDYSSAFSSGTKEYSTATIEMSDETQVVITIQPYASSYSNMKVAGILADYDAATGTVTINCSDNSGIGTFTDTDSKVEYTLDFLARQLVPIPDDPEGKGEWKMLDELTGVVNADGTITFGDANTMFGFAIVEQAGYWAGGFRGATFVAPDWFKFEASEWVSAGNAKFTDNFINQFLEEDQQDYLLKTREIPVYINKANPKVFCVENPYAVSNWLNEDPNTTGYLVFSLENPALVPMRPLTASGLWLTMTQGGFPEEWYIYNLEGGQYYNQEQSFAEIIELFKNNKTTPSSFDETTKVVTLRNLCFGYSSNPGGSSYYPFMVDPTITIESASFAGVEDIIADSEDAAVAPARYFNLQGMEVANPEAGQLVIKKEGSKTTKMIVR